ncbi:MAG: M48 family metalloprotease [Magnetococcales bacterium]|nr:M48 family metalloprotease [Magnetococcales bacterium]
MFAWQVSVDSRNWQSQQWRNIWQTVLLLAAMTGLMSLLGWMLAGEEGVGWSVLLTVVVYWMTPHMAPALILRLSQARWLDPTLHGGLYRLAAQLAQKAGLPTTPQMYLIPSPVANAFAVGSGEEAAVALSQGLLQRLDQRQLTGVLAHEISHIRHGDTRVMALADIFRRLTMGLSIVGQLLVLLALPLILSGKAEIFIPAWLLLLAAPSLSGLLQLALSRTREFNADLEAVALTGDPLGLATALQQIERPQRGFWQQIFLPYAPGNEEAWLRTHPPVAERVRRLQQVSQASRVWLPRWGWNGI